MRKERGKGKKIAGLQNFQKLTSDNPAEKIEGNVSVNGAEHSATLKVLAAPHGENGNPP